MLELLLALAPADHPPALHTAALRETFANQQRFAAMQQDDDRPLVMLAYALLAEGQRRGEVRADVDALSLAMTVVAGVLFPLVQTGFGAGPTPEAALRRSFSIVWPGSTRRRRSAPPRSDAHSPPAARANSAASSVRERTPTLA